MIVQSLIECKKKLVGETAPSGGRTCFTINPFSRSDNSSRIYGPAAYNNLKGTKDYSVAVFDAGYLWSVAI